MSNIPIARWPPGKIVPEAGCTYSLVKIAPSLVSADPPNASVEREIAQWLMFGSVGPNLDVDIGWIGRKITEALPGLVDGTEQLWAVFGPDGVCGAFRTTIVEFGRSKALCIFDLAGDFSLHDWFGEVERTLSRFGRGQGCSVLRGCGGQIHSLLRSDIRGYQVVGEHAAHPVYERAMA